MNWCIWKSYIKKRHWKQGMYVAFMQWLFRREWHSWVSLMMMKMCHSKRGLKWKTHKSCHLSITTEWIHGWTVLTTRQNMIPSPCIQGTSSAYLHNLQDCLKDDKCIVLLDFAENYSYVVQHIVHAVLLLTITKSKTISAASATVCYHTIFIIMQMLLMSLFITCSRGWNVYYHMCHMFIVSWWSSIPIQEFQRFNKSNSPSRLPWVEWWVRISCHKLWEEPLWWYRRHS